MEYSEKDAKRIVEKAKTQMAFGSVGSSTVKELLGVVEQQLKLLNLAVVSNNEVAVCDIAMCEKSAGASIFYDPCKDCADNPQTDC